VEIRVPAGTLVAPVSQSGVGTAYSERLLVGLQQGAVYRFRVNQLPAHPEVEVYPTVELVDRLHPPAGEALKFPVPIDLTTDELLMAAEGRYITRVIYVEDPRFALPIARQSAEEVPWFEVRPGDDPLVMADQLGRPIAIVRIGGRKPQPQQPESDFAFGSPEPVIYDPPLPTAVVQPAAATQASNR
jgi:hypothetical protein